MVVFSEKTVVCTNYAEAICLQKKKKAVVEVEEKKKSRAQENETFSPLIVYYCCRW